MTDDVGWAALGIRPDFTGFPSALSRGVAGPMERTGREGGSRLVTGMRATVRRGASSIIAPILGAFAGFEVINFFKDSNAEARESQKVNALTTQTLDNLGNQASVTARHIGALANAQSRKAAIDDEAIQSGENALLNYSQIRNEVGKHNRIFDRATKASVNYAAALAGTGGGAPNVTSAARLVGKVLADPEKGLSRLTRAGVIFTKQQQDSVKAFVATGDIMGAQKIILHGLEQRYDGAAKSQATMGEKVSVAWKNVEEQFGTALLPLIDDVERALLNKGLPTVSKWVNVFQRDGVPAVENFADVLRDKGIPMAKQLVDKGKPLAESILPAIGTAAHDIADGLSAAAPYAAHMVDAFNNAPDWVQKGTVFTALAALGGKKLGLFDRSGGQSAIGALVRGASGSSPATAIWVRPVPGSGGIGGAGGGSGGNQVITKGDDEGKTKRRGRLKGAGNLVASAVASFFGPELVAEGSKEIVWPWEKGPLGSTPQHNPIDQFVQSLAGQTPKVSTQSLIDQVVAMLPQDWSKRDKKLLFGVDVDTKKADAKLTMFRQKAEKPIQVPIAVEVQTGLTNFFEDAFGGAKPGPLTHGRGAGVTVNIDKMMAHDYGDMQRQLQQRAQAANLGGRPTGVTS